MKRQNLNLNYFEHFLLFISIATGCVLISAFPSSVGISVGITSSVLGQYSLLFAIVIQNIGQNKKKWHTNNTKWKIMN